MLALVLGCATRSPVESNPGNRPALSTDSIMPERTLEDQYGVPATVPDGFFFIFLTRDPHADALVREAFLGPGAQRVLLSGEGAYISDISGKPSMISAVPAMRMLPYRILLDRDGTATADLPSVEGKVTMIFAHNGEVVAIDFMDSSAAVLQAMTPLR